MKILLLAAFLPCAAFAQGTVLFTWHGNSNFFQASFEITAAEMQPGGHFTSQLFYDSISVDSLSGIHYSYGGTGIANGDAQPFALAIDLFDFNRGTEIYLDGASDFTGIADEKPFSGAHLFTERGYWTYTYVPEPSMGSLLVVAVGVWLVGKRRKSF